MFDEDEDTVPYIAVVDDEEQYAIWLAYKPIPAGWRKAEKSGTKQECLDFISHAWTDMRPLSLRRHGDAQ